MIFVPILISSFISIIMMFFMKLTRFIKSKEMFQILITAILLAAVFVIETLSVQNLTYDGSIKLETQEEVTQYVNQKMEDLNRYILPSKLAVGVLDNSNSLEGLCSMFELIILTIFVLIIFIFIGKITYLKNLLKGTKYFSKRKNDKINHKKIEKSKSIGRVYVAKELKNIFRNVAFLLQCIWPIFVWIIAIIILVIILLPNINYIFSNEELVQTMNESVLDIQIITAILCVLQFIYTVSNISITSISRDGKNALFMKYIPIDLYKQVWYKSMPQIIINIFVTISILLILGIFIDKIQVTWLIAIFIISTIINIINSVLMVLVDLKRPNLNWNSEYQLIKQNSNKIFQYVLMIIIILLLLYMTSVFQNFDLNLIVSIIILIVFFGIILLLINRYIKKRQNKIFKNIF